MDASNRDLSALLNLAFRVARREGLCVADAEDVSSATVIRYLEVSGEIKHASAWVFLVARRKAWALRRKSLVRDKREAEQQDLFAGEQYTDAESMENLLDLKAALGALGNTERVAILWRDLKGESLGVIANSTGLSVETVKRRLKKGRDSLRRSLSGRSVRTSLRLAQEHGSLCFEA